MKNSDPKLFRELSLPFPNREVACEAMEKFANEVYDLRVKYRIPNAVLLMTVGYTDGDEEPQISNALDMGDPVRCLTLTAACFGAAQERHNAELAETVAMGRRTARKTK